MNNATDANAFLAYIGVEDPAVLSEVVPDSDPAFQLAMRRLMTLKDWDWESVIIHCLSPIRAMFVGPFPTIGASETPRFIDLLMIRLIIENHLLAGEDFLPDHRYLTVRSAMMRLLPADMHQFPHTYTRDDFRSRVAEIGNRPNTRENARRRAAADADPQSRGF